MTDADHCRHCGLLICPSSPCCEDWERDEAAKPVPRLGAVEQEVRRQADVIREQGSELRTVLAQRAVVLALHWPEAILVGETPQWCHTCMDGEDAVAYPCPTVRALGVTG